jgi:uncharacterized membrane protein YfcA
VEISFWIPLIFFFIAFFYSMAGLGGGSSYLAVLILAGLSYQKVPALALACNVIVTVSGFLHFYRAGYFKWKTVLPFVVLSVPMAYWGASLVIHKKLFSVLLGLSLLAVVFRIFLPAWALKEKKDTSFFETWAMGLPVGGFLGFFSGLVGIGGGIFLSPFLLLMRWANAKEAAASASFFIVVNSLAGLAGQFHKGWGDLSLIAPLAAAVFLGGQTGAFFSAYRLPHRTLEKVMGALIFYASMKLLWGIG